MNFYEYANVFCNINLEELSKVNEVEQYFENSKIVEKNLTDKLSKKLIEKYNNNELFFSGNLSGHNFWISLQKLIDKEPNEKCFHDIASAIVIDVASQSFSNYSMMNLMKEANNTDGKFYEDLQLNLIDVDKLLEGNLQWPITTVSKPEMSCFECLNDGKKYILTMNDWKIDFIDRQDFVRNKKISTIQPFDEAYQATQTKIDFKTKELVVFNFLPREISDFIDGHFSKSSFEFKGKDWDKFHNETMACFGILRTPSYGGGTVFQDDNYLILGSSKADTDPSNNIGSTIDTVWQTLIAEKENMIKLIMLALDKNKDEAEDYFKTNLIEEQNAVIVNVEPGLYYSYCIPGDNSNRIKNDYMNIKMNDITDINIDMIISKKKIKTAREMDSKNIMPKFETKSAKENFESFKTSSSTLKI